MPGPDPHRAALPCRPSLESIFGPVEADLQKVQHRIARIVQAREPQIRQRLIRLMDRPGKMIRPAVLLLAAKACGRRAKHPVELAAIVELIHSATLLHDDVIDRASVRRGRPSANTLWGNTAAVLLGDFLLSRAFALGIKLNRPEISGWLIGTAEEICQGELLQNLHRADWGLTEAQYLRMIDGKTAALFACSAAVGARAAGADPSAVEAMNRYGRRLGRAFQIRDDLLDLMGTEETCGKTLGTDLAECKLTLPLIVWLRRLPARKKQQEIRRLSEDRQIRRIAGQVRQSGAVEEVLQVLEKLCRQAARSLDRIPDSPAREGLLRLAQTLSCPL